MDQYLVSARKYRPSTFRSVVGQKALTTTLKNAVATQRLAHSYLFCGSRGVGKTSCARIFAKTINCEHPTPDGEACNECPSCRSFNEGTSMNIMELDAAANNSVDAIRSLTDMTVNPPSTGKYRVFIVDEVHMLSQAAFNAFLKTLEEPPNWVIFILATTEKHKILPTILSRCQIYDFARITIQDIIDHLAYVASQEGITADVASLNVIARKADGAMRDALSIFDQVAASSMGNITYESTIANLNVLDNSYYTRLLSCFLEGRVLDSWLIYKEIRDKGFDSHFFINGLASYFRDLMVAQSPETLHLIEAGDDTKQQLAQEAAKCHPLLIHRAMSLLNEADLNYRTATNKQFLTELTLAKICQLSSPSPVDGSNGEGQRLQPIAATQTATTTPQAPTPQAPVPAQPKVTPKVQQAATPAQQQTAPRSAVVTTTQRPPMSGAVRTPLGKMRINNSAEEAPVKDKPQEMVQEVSGREAAYTPQQFNDAWDTYINTHPTEHILINAMRSSKPDPSTGITLAMTVENEMQRDTVNAALPELLKHLRDTLGNDLITLQVNLNSGQASTTVWNEREVLDHMLKEIPELANYISDFKLTL